MSYYSEDEIKEKFWDENFEPFDGSDYETGELEALRYGLEYASKGLLNLLRALVNKNIISLDEAVEICSRYHTVESVKVKK